MELRLRDLRKDMGWTQAKLASKLHINRRTYSAYETGTNSVPLDILIKLSEIYDTNMAYLLGETNSYDPQPKNIY